MIASRRKKEASDKPQKYHRENSDELQGDLSSKNLEKDLVSFAKPLRYSAISWVSFCLSILVCFLFLWDPPLNAHLKTLDRAALLRMARTSTIGNDSDWPLFGLRSVVTGATSGLGKAIATELYGLGATVILPNRSREKCDTAQKEMEFEYPTSRGSIDCNMQMDLSDFSTVESFAKEYQARYTDLHILINNAGMHYVSNSKQNALLNLSEMQVSKDGFDYSFAANYMGHFLLTRLLLPHMIRTENSSGSDIRIINVSSSYHLQADGTMLVPGPDGMPEAARADVNTYLHRSRAYSNSKLAQVLHAKELQKRAQAFGSSRLRVHSICPAWVKTGILPDNLGGQFVANKAFTPKAASLAALGAILSNGLQGGEFVSVFQNFFTTQSWSSSMFHTLTALGIRDFACNVLSMWILARQGNSYGFHVQPSSPEAEDADRQKALYNWTEDVFAARDSLRAQVHRENNNLAQQME